MGTAAEGGWGGTASQGSRACLLGLAMARFKVIRPIGCACACWDSAHAIGHSVSLCLCVLLSPCFVKVTPQRWQPCTAEAQLPPRGGLQSPVWCCCDRHHAAEHRGRREVMSSSLSRAEQELSCLCTREPRFRTDSRGFQAPSGEAALPRAPLLCPRAPRWG